MTITKMFLIDCIKGKCGVDLIYNENKARKTLNEYFDIFNILLENAKKEKRSVEDIVSSLKSLGIEIDETSLCNNDPSNIGGWDDCDGCQYFSYNTECCIPDSDPCDAEDDVKSCEQCKYCNFICDCCFNECNNITIEDIIKKGV